MIPVARNRPRKKAKLGLTVRAITSDMADKLNITAGKGVIVQDVKNSSFADDVGLTRGDVILEINKQPVNTEADFNRVASALKSGQDVVFLVRQRGAGNQDGTIFLAGHFRNQAETMGTWHWWRIGDHEIALSVPCGFEVNIASATPAENRA